MDTTEVGLVLEVRTKETIRPEVIDRAKAMLFAVLSQTGVTGAWRYDILMSDYKALPDPSQYRMAAELLGDTQSLLHIALRSSLMVGGTVAGILRQTGFADFKGLIKLLSPAIAERNRSNWVAIIAQEERTSMAPRGLADIEAELKLRRSQPELPPARVLPLVDGTGRVVRNNSAHRRAQATPPRVPVARTYRPRVDRSAPVRSVGPPDDPIEDVVAVPPSPPPPPCAAAWPSFSVHSPPERSADMNAKARTDGPASDADASSDESAAYVALLKELIPNCQNGVFKGSDVTHLAPKHLPGKSELWYRFQSIKRLLRLKFVRPVMGPSQYQVERSFLDTYGFAEFALEPITRLQRQSKKAKGLNGKGSHTQIRPSDMVPIMQKLQLRRLELMGAVQAALAHQAEVAAETARAVAAAQEELRVFDQSLRESFQAAQLDGSGESPIQLLLPSAEARG